MKKYEKLIEHIINENEEEAKKLFHSIVVEKSREIYENLMADEESTEDDVIGGNDVDDFVDDVEADIDDEEFDDVDDDDFDIEDDESEDTEEFELDDVDDDEDADEELEDRVLDLEDELDALKAEFDRLMSDENDEDVDELEIDSEEDVVDIDDEIESEDDFEVDSDFDADEDDSEPMDDTEIMREYVEKVKELYKSEPSEGGEVGSAGSTVNVNKKSVTDNMKNDMGGTNANIAKGGSEKNPDGQRPTGKAAGLVKPAQEIDVAKRQVNKVGGDKGAQKFFDKNASGEKAEGATTDGKVSVQKKSVLKARRK